MKVQNNTKYHENMEIFKKREVNNPFRPRERKVKAEELDKIDEEIRKYLNSFSSSKGGE